MVVIHLHFLLKHLSVAGLDFGHNLVVVLELFATEVLNSNVGWWDGRVEGPLGWDPLSIFEHLTVVLAGLLFVDETREHLVLNEFAHA